MWHVNFVTLQVHPAFSVIGNLHWAEIEALTAYYLQQAGPDSYPVRVRVGNFVTAPFTA